MPASPGSRPLNGFPGTSSPPSPAFLSPTQSQRRNSSFQGSGLKGGRAADAVQRGHPGKARSGDTAPVQGPAPPAPPAREALLHFMHRWGFQVQLLLKKFRGFFFWPRWVFVAARGLSLVAASRRYSSLPCAGFSLRWLLLLRSTGSRCTGFSSCGVWAQQLWLAVSVVVAHRLSCSVACGIFLDQGSNPCPLHWQVDS